MNKKVETKFLKDTDFDALVVSRHCSQSPLMAFILTDDTNIPEDSVLDYQGNTSANPIDWFIVRHPKLGKHKVPIADIQAVFLIPEGQHVFRESPKTP